MKVSLSVMFNCYLQKLNKVRFKNVNLVSYLFELFISKIWLYFSYDFGVKVEMHLKLRFKTRYQILYLRFLELE